MYSREFGDRTNDLSKATLIGSFSSMADAQKSSKSVTRGYIEVVGDSSGEQARTGIQTTVTINKNTQELGNFVTDVSLVPYIRPQTIDIIVRGMKANTKYYTYFDGEDMSDYVTPIVIPSVHGMSLSSPTY